MQGLLLTEKEKYINFILFGKPLPPPKGEYLGIQLLWI
jgi:hypothetical protein